MSFSPKCVSRVLQETACPPSRRAIWILYGARRHKQFLADPSINHAILVLMSDAVSADPTATAW